MVTLVGVFFYWPPSFDFNNFDRYQRVSIYLWKVFFNLVYQNLTNEITKYTRLKINGELFKQSQPVKVGKILSSKEIKINDAPTFNEPGRINIENNFVCSAMSVSILFLFSDSGCNQVRLTTRCLCRLKFFKMVTLVKVLRCDDDSSNQNHPCIRCLF